MESYIHLYKTNSEFTEAYNSPNYKEPWLSLTEEGMAIGYNKPKSIDFSTEPLTFNILSAGTINWTASNSSVTKTIEYKINDGGWASITSNTGSSAPKIEVNSGDKLQFRGNNATYCGDNPDLYSTFGGSTAEFEIEGNIMSLINPTDFSALTTLDNYFTFTGLFSDCTGLTSAENLILPATTLAIGCYMGMFQGCTSLTTAPALPAMTLAMACYVSMFSDCKKLTIAPELPANTLVDSCYTSMFQSCTSLTTAPALPATSLTEGCYSHMFQGCTSLITAPALPATTLAKDCYRHMFDGCTSLTTVPELPATTLADDCYNGMFINCTSLSTAPELPATTLANNCYSYMFNKCTSLNYIKCLATNISATNCTSNWVSGVSSTGTFAKAPSMASWTRGNSGIPTGWRVQDA